MRLLIRLALAASGAALIPAVCADQLDLKNGDRLSGTIVQQSEHILQLETSYAGVLRLNVDSIRSIRFEPPRKLLVGAKRIVQVSDVEILRGQARLALQESGESLTVDLDSISTPAQGTRDSADRSAFTGRVNLAFEQSEGNAEKTELDLDYLLLYRRPHDRYRSEGEGEFDTNRGLRVKQDWSVNAQYDHFFTTRLYAGVVAEFKQEKSAGLDLRVATGPLLGYQFYETVERNLLVELAALRIEENYQDLPSRDGWGPGWRVRFDQFLLGERLQFYHNQRGFVASKDAAKLIWQSFTGFRLPLLMGFVGSTEMELDYDGKPALDAEKLDTTFRVKIGYAW